jgi:hypothetical protein
MDSEWWDKPAYEACTRIRSGILDDDKYEYDVHVGAQEPAMWAPPPQEREAKEEPIQVEEYMPPCLSEEEAIRLAMEQSEILELSQWDDLGMQLHASRLGIAAACSSDPAPCVGGANGPASFSRSHLRLLMRRRLGGANGGLAVPLESTAADRPHQGQRRR